MKNVNAIKSHLKRAVDIPKEKRAIFFKTGKGDYAEHDQFMGVKIPTLRRIAKDFSDLTLKELQALLNSKINEERMIALFILISQYDAGDAATKEKIYKFYLKNLKNVNNWNLIDASAHLIVGAQLLNKDKSILLKLADSNDLWERRVAIVATWYFIRNKKLTWTFKLAKLFLNDTHDLIHKSVGWMLREAGKCDEEQLVKFLDLHTLKMPRTMLRYSIEKFPEKKRLFYLKKK